MRGQCRTEGPCPRSECDCGFYDARVDATAPEPDLVVVKPLEWKPYRNGDADAVTPFSEIYTAYAGGAWRVTINGKAGKFIMAGSDLEAAKAGAQADYERRIRAALSTATPEKQP